MTTVTGPMNHATRWFRRPETWRILAGFLLRHPVRPVTIWSGACSTGEEAFSAAILLDMVKLPGRVIAADADRDAIAHARFGRYDVDDARDVHGLDLTPWLKPDGQGVLVAPGIASRIDFTVRDLRDPGSVPAGCDVAIVRNVWRYLSDDEQHDLARRIASRLAPGGVLVLGGSDKTLPGLTPPTAVVHLFTEGAGGVWRRKFPSTT